MSEIQVYLWNNRRAIEHLKGEQMVCRSCGQNIPCYPLEEVLRHSLIHAQGEELAQIKEMIGWVTDPEQRRELVEAAMQESGGSKLIAYGLQNGILTRLRGED